MMTLQDFQDYLTKEGNEGTKTEFRLVASKQRSNKVVTIYIHPLGKDGQSLDFEIDGNTLRCITPDPATVPVEFGGTLESEANATAQAPDGPL
jgi:hypothetical protein